MKVIYSLYDNKALEYVGALMVFPNVAVATRQYGEIIRENKHIRENVEDYDLVQLGAFDETNGTLHAGLATAMTGKQYKDGMGGQ